MLHAVLPAPVQLSQAFQEGNVPFAAISHAAKYTVDTIQGVASPNKPLEDLKKDLDDGGRLSNCDLPKVTGTQEQHLINLTQKYTKALKENMESRFLDSQHVGAFRIFDPTTVPGGSDPAFKDYGADHITMLASFFYSGHHSQAEMKEELLCTWQKFKYNLLQMKEQIPSEVLNPPTKKELVSKSPTKWALKKMLQYSSKIMHVQELLFASARRSSSCS